MATIADLASASGAAAGDLLVIRQGSTDRKIDAGLVAWTNAPVSFGGVITLTANTAPKLTLSDIDNGTGGGPRVVIGRNNNASTPATGCVLFYNKSGIARYLWPDAADNIRTNGSAPINANDLAGTVVGTQTSSLDAKNIHGEPPSGAAALVYVERGALAVREFTYKNGSFNGERFSGLVVDFAPRYGMDKDAAHPAGKSLNVINAVGDLMLAVSYLAGRVRELEARLNTAAG